MAREDWDTYFLNIAKQAATRATCPRASVGAVLVRDRAILSTGYNGSARGLQHCTDPCGCMMEDNHCVRTVHAELNAIAQAARHGVALSGAYLYCTHMPCWPCFRTLVNAGISKIYYGEAYRRDGRVEQGALECNILLTQIL